MIDVGDKAPAFTTSATGKVEELNFKELRGKKVVLYFYPKDDTPGCTLEAKDFSRLKEKFSAAGVFIFGISKDSIAKHNKVIAKHDLQISLVCDEDGAICKAYDVWTEKKNYGRIYMGIERSTFLINEKGKVAKVWRKVRVKGHAEAVLKSAMQI